MSAPATTRAAARWASVEEAAEHVGLSEKTIRRYIAEGRLPGYRIGKRVLRVDLNDVDDLLRPIPTGGGRIA